MLNNMSRPRGVACTLVTCFSRQLQPNKRRAIGQTRLTSAYEKANKEHHKGRAFQTEKIGIKSNLYRLRPLVEHPTKEVNTLYSRQEVELHHIRLVEEVDAACERADKNQYVGFHGTANIYQDSLVAGIEYRRNRHEVEACQQLGEGFYIAIGKQAEAMAFLFAGEAVNGISRARIKADQKVSQENMSQENEQKPKIAILAIEADALADMRGLVLPQRFCWDGAVEQGDSQSTRCWREDETKRLFIEEYDYIASIIDMAQHQALSVDLMQIKFNPHVLGQLRACAL